MLDKFQSVKETFAGPPGPGEQPQDNWIDLPPKVGETNDPQRGIEQGRLLLT